MREEDLVRGPEYWATLESHVRTFAEAKGEELKKALQLSHDREFIKVVIGTNSEKLSPCVRITSQGNVELEFPIAYFEWLDNSARWMNLDVPFRQALAFDKTFPNVDLSTYFHDRWAHWIVLHELGHALCGHLGVVSKAGLNEFPAAQHGDTDDNGLPMKLRRAMEVDADVWAARAMFRTLGSMAVKGYFDDLYHFKHAVTYAMQDIGMIMLPLFLELDHMAVKTPTTHPSTFERMVLLQVFGFAGYLDRVRDVGREHLSSFLAGLKKAMELTVHIKGSLLHKAQPEVNLVSHWKELTSFGMQRRRLFPLDDDWLQKVPPGLSSPGDLP